MCFSNVVISFQLGPSNSAWFTSYSQSHYTKVSLEQVDSLHDETTGNQRGRGGLPKSKTQSVAHLNILEGDTGIPSQPQGVITQLTSRLLIEDRLCYFYNRD